MSFKLVPLTDEFMCRTKFGLPRMASLYPSEASVKWTDQYGIERVAGQCMRQGYWRLTHHPSGGKPSPYSEWIFALGKAVEEILVEQYKQMGIWVANNVKFYDPERNISGEVDVIIRDPETGELLCLEAKSFYGYNASKDLCGSKKGPGHPKTSQMLQALIYTDLGNRLNLFKYTKMVYYARDSANRAEFDITLVQDGEHKRPAVDNVIDFRFTMQDIYDRYALLTEYVKNNTLPPREYERAYSPEKVALLNSIGEVSKTAMIDYKKNPSKNPIGDWICDPTYCPYYKECYSKD